MQGQKQVLKFRFVFVPGGLDRVAHNDAQAFQLVAGEFDEVPFHVPVIFPPESPLISYSSTFVPSSTTWEAGIRK